MMDMQAASALNDLVALMVNSVAANAEGRHLDSLVYLDQALALEPDFFPAHSSRGDLLHAMARYDEALAAYDQCLLRSPQLEHVVLARSDTIGALLEQCDQQLSRQPDDVAVLFKRGLMLVRQEQYALALANIDHLLSLAPTNLEALNQRGNILLELNRHEEALLCYDRILAFKADQASAWFNRGNVLRKMNCLNQALWCYQEALTVQPDLIAAQVAQSHSLLTLGDFAAGWPLHEARWQIPDIRMHGIKSQAPRWLGQTALSGKTVLLWAEQGLGDSLQFVRYIPLVAETAAQVIVCVPPALARLLESLMPPSLLTIITNDKVLPPHDMHCPLMSLPLALSWRLATVPADVPYLFVDAALKEQWAQQLGPRDGNGGDAGAGGTALAPLRAGLVWSGRRYGVPNRGRDMALRDLLPLAHIGIEVISVQQERLASDAEAHAAWPQLREFGAGLTDMAQTAALISNLDVVISVDTAIVHLAGALGIPALLMLRYEGEWRWGQPGEQGAPSLWYPSVRVFRQEKRADWQPVVSRVRACLADWQRGAQQQDQRR